MESLRNQRESKEAGTTRRDVETIEDVVQYFRNLETVVHLKLRFRRATNNSDDRDADRKLQVFK
jgi:hypothetical protein